MLYRGSLTIPASASELAPATTVVAVTYGIVRQVSVSFPPGAAALANTACRYHGVQIWPSNLGEYLAWDDVTLSWPEEIPLFIPPFELEIVGWSTDDTFPHAVVWRWAILPPRAERAGRLAQRLFGSLADFGDL